MRSYFFLMQGKKRRRCLASTRLFNAAEDEQTPFVNRLRTGCQEQVEECKFIIELFLKRFERLVFLKPHYTFAPRFRSSLFLR